ncbi:MAG: hypothetical protein K2X36_07075 [Microbacteriaceae bacterium]|nr:hypothetical protein [Microbacteriaceae bacterium]
MLDAAACLAPGSRGDTAAELRRQVVLAAALRDRLDDIVRSLPRDEALAGWWGPARDALQGAVDLERARLAREVERLESVRIRLLFVAEEAAAMAPGSES